MRTHTTQETPQTKKTPTHNPIIIERGTETNISEIIRLLATPNTTIIYVTPNSDHCKNAMMELQHQMEDRLYEVNIADKTVKLLNGSILRFMRGDRTMIDKLRGLIISKAYIDGQLSLNATDYRELMQAIISRVRPTGEK